MELNDFINKIATTKELTFYDKIYKIENCCMATDGNVLKAKLRLSDTTDTNISIFISVTNTQIKK